MKKIQLNNISKALGMTAIIGSIAFFAVTTTVAKNENKVTEASVVSHYADIALHTFSDSLDTAKQLEAAVIELTKNPTTTNLTKAKGAWIKARAPYQQTEVYRFGNAIVDEWEGKVNAWPLDEGLIDYVAPSYGADSEENALYTANVVQNSRLTLSGEQVDASKITKTLLAETLHEIDGVEANVATGYHAIEFLLWGQDLNGTNAGAGNRPVTDFDVNNCSWGNCQRRIDYLLTATSLLIDDLAWMVQQWQEKGAARQALLNDPNAGVATILTGMGSLSYGELAGERIKLGVLLHDPEEEHDCFSDNTHNSHFYNIQGIDNVYSGSYTKVNGQVVAGPSLYALLATQDKTLATTLKSAIHQSLAKAQVLVDSAEKQGVAYDQLLAENNPNGNAKILAVVNALTEQTQSIEQAVVSLGLNKIEFEGSDSLDNPNAVFQ